MEKNIFYLFFLEEWVMRKLVVRLRVTGSPAGENRIGLELWVMS